MANLTESELRKLVAGIVGQDPSEIHPDTSFRQVSSIRFYRFLARVESLVGKKLGNPATITTYGFLSRALGVEPMPDKESRAAVYDGGVGDQQLETREPFKVNGFGHVVGIGHDIEELSNLPDTNDYASHPFYVRYFTPAEIAACTSKRNPLEHFAVRFCAKEALRKSHQVFLEIDPSDIEVTNDNMGKPSLVIANARTRRILDRFKILTSFSHTDSLASAFVVVTC